MKVKLKREYQNRHFTELKTYLEYKVFAEQNGFFQVITPRGNTVWIAKYKMEVVSS